VVCKWVGADSALLRCSVGDKEMAGCTYWWKTNTQTRVRGGVKQKEKGSNEGAGHSATSRESMRSGEDVRFEALPKAERVGPTSTSFHNQQQRQ